MKQQTSTPINTSIDDISNGDSKIKLDDETQFILKSFLTEYGIEPKNWRQIISAWYKDYPYVPLKEIDKMALMEFTIQFKLFLLSQLSEILNIEQKAFAESSRRQNTVKISTLRM
jgi:hypothetical protein